VKDGRRQHRHHPLSASLRLVRLIEVPDAGNRRDHERSARKYDHGIRARLRSVTPVRRPGKPLATSHSRPPRGRGRAGWIGWSAWREGSRRCVRSGSWR
jgi:hypothetical protein